MGFGKSYRLQDHPQMAEALDIWEPNRRRGRASAVPAGTTFIVSNFPAFAAAEVIDSGNNATAAANGDLASGSWVVSVSGTAADDANKIVTATAATRRDWNPWIRFKFHSGSNIASVRWWVGAFASDPSALNTLATISGACFGFDTLIDGTSFWRCETGNASTAKLTTTDMPVVASTVYTGEIRMDTANARIDFYMASHGLNSVAKTQSPLRQVASHGSSVPVATTPLLLGATVTVNATAALAKRIGLGEVAISHD